MGFMLPEFRTIRLEFDKGSDLAGAVVRCKSTSQSDLDRITEMPMVEAVHEFVRDYVISWDLEDKDGPIPSDEAGLGRVEPRHLNAMHGAWFRGLYAINAPLESASSTSDSQAAS